MNLNDEFASQEPLPGINSVQIDDQNVSEERLGGGSRRREEDDEEDVNENPLLG